MRCVANINLCMCMCVCVCMCVCACVRACVSLSLLSFSFSLSTFFHSLARACSISLTSASWHLKRQQLAYYLHY